MSGETVVTCHVTEFERIFGRIGAAPNRERQLSPGPNPHVRLDRRRVAMQSTEPEIWKPVFGFEGLYEVSDAGRVRRDTTARGRGAVPGRVIAANTNRPGGYRWVTLYHQGFGTKVYVHRAVARAFLPASKSDVVRHRDDNPANNAASNLAWGTQADNVRDMLERGRARNGWGDAAACIHGHAFTKENTYITKRGHRACRACARIRAYRKYHQEAS